MKGVPPRRQQEIAAVLDRVGERLLGEPEPVEDSVLGENYRATTDRGTRFVRFAQEKRTREVVFAEYGAMRFAGAQGIPVALPLLDAHGSPAVMVAGRAVSVFPWVAGRTAVRGAISEDEAATLGDMHGRLQQALALYEDPVLAARNAGEIAWDTEASIAALSRVDDLIRYYPSPPEAHRRAQQALRYQLALLESSEPRRSSDFDGLPRQVEHGDYHERNVMLAATGEVAAVVDWERVRVLPRAFQLVRAVDFIGLLEGGPLEAYLAGYGLHVLLSPEECPGAVEQWWQSVLHNTWVFTDVFVRGNARSARFIAEHQPRLERLRDAEFRKALAATIARHAAA